MKNIKMLMFFIVLLGAFASCKKDENQIYFEGGTPPVLTVTPLASMVLTGANASTNVVYLSWTNPDYRFTTGLSSQDVSYTLQIDSAGKNFSSSKLSESSISKELEVKYTVKQFNALVSNWAENKAHKLEMRIKASLKGAVPVFSNVQTITVTPYLDVVVPLPPTNELYITGSAAASDWTNNPPANQKATGDQASMTSTGKFTIFTITQSFIPGKEYKFLSTLGAWQPQYGSKDQGKTGGELSANMGSGSDPDPIPTPDAAGTYKITLNFKKGTYTVEKI
jgi:starch-binding outer membrane protein SusE/F